MAYDAVLQGRDAKIIRKSGNFGLSIGWSSPVKFSKFTCEVAKVHVRSFLSRPEKLVKSTRFPAFFDTSKSDTLQALCYFCFLFDNFKVDKSYVVLHRKDVGQSAQRTSTLKGARIRLRLPVITGSLLQELPLLFHLRELWMMKLSGSFLRNHSWLCIWCLL